MTGPTKNYLSGDSSAFAWFREHFPAPKDMEPRLVFTAKNGFLSDLQGRPMFATGRGRTLEPPLFKLPLLSTPSNFALARGEEQLVPKPAPSSYTNTAHKETESEDDDPNHALADFDHQFEKWKPAGASRGTAANDTPPAKREEILLYENTPEGLRTAVHNAVKYGYVNSNNKAQMETLMHMLANAPNAKAQDNAKSTERSVDAGGAVLRETTEDGQVNKPGQSSRPHEQARHSDDVEAQQVKKVEPVKSGRLKGKVRKEAKKANKK